jgi:hypothetical protein
LSVPKTLRRDQALILDFDGTLVDITVAPNLVQLPGLPRLLCELSQLLDGAVAVVSGRLWRPVAHAYFESLGLLDPKASTTMRKDVIFLHLLDEQADYHCSSNDVV